MHILPVESEKMEQYFNNKERIDKTCVLKYFSIHEDKRTKMNGGETDTNAMTIIKELKKDDTLNYWKCNSTCQTVNKLRLPYHIHNNKGDKSDIELVGKNGILLKDFYRVFEEHRNNPPKKECIDKIVKLKRVFFASPSNSYKPDFILLSNDGNLVHKGNYFGKYTDELFIANGFHRLAAYSLALKELGHFFPIEIYYGHNPNIVNKCIEMKG